MSGFREGLIARLAALTGHEDEGDEETEASTRTPRRVPLSELGEDFFVPVVSLVRRGQVPKAKIVALKSQTEQQQEAPRRDRHGYRIVKPHGVPGQSEERKPGKRQQRDSRGRVVSKRFDPRNYERRQ